VVLAAGGYPGDAESNKLISGIDAAAAVPGALVFHAGTSRRDGKLVTAGGRVLTVVGRGPTHRDAIDVAYRAASQIQFEGMQYRRDIGRKALQPIHDRGVTKPRENETGFNFSESQRKN
jgi:phosphoribosylamine--glycine ligase